MAKITQRQLERIILEEFESIDEDAFSKMMAKAKGLGKEKPSKAPGAGEKPATEKKPEEEKGEEKKPEEEKGEEKKEGNIAKKLEKLGLKALKKGQAAVALNQLRNKGIDAKKFNTAIVKAIKDIHKQAGPQRKNFAQKDAPLIKKIGNEIVKILKGDFSNLVKESRGDGYLVQPETYEVIRLLLEEKKKIKLFIKRKTNNG